MYHKNDNPEKIGHQKTRQQHLHDFKDHPIKHKTHFYQQEKYIKTKQVIPKEIYKKVVKDQEEKYSKQNPKRQHVLKQISKKQIKVEKIPTTQSKNEHIFRKPKTKGQQNTKKEKKEQEIIQKKEIQQKSIFMNLPVPILNNILSYLNLADYIHFRNTCSLLHEVFYLKSFTYTKNMNYEAKQNANIMCWECQIDRLQEPMEIMMIKFTFLTKDQGWASATYSTSWIEAEMFDKNGLNLIRQNDPQKEKTRLYLVDNYSVQNYQYKSKTIKDRNLLVGLNSIKIYLRSQYPGWEIYCKRAEIRIMYTSSIYQS